jgi:CBS domain-containing protein
MFINLFDGLIPLDRNAFHEDMKRIAAYQVKDIMSAPAIYAYENTPISEIAEVIINKKINRIPIVNEIMEVVGIVSRHDIVRSMVMEADAAVDEIE